MSDTTAFEGLVPNNTAFKTDPTVCKGEDIDSLKIHAAYDSDVEPEYYCDWGLGI